MLTPTSADTEFEIRALAARDSLAALTTLLHRAYAHLAAQGLNLTAATQSEDATRQRTLEGQCHVAAHRGRLIGTITVSSPIDTVSGDWVDVLPLYRDRGTVHFHQFAVDPDWRGRGVARGLLAQAEEWALARGYRRMAVDMAEPAEELCAFYRYMGYRVVGHVQWPGKTYRSVVMEKLLDRSPLLRQLMTMARYNAWATDRLLAAVAPLDDAAYRRPLGLAFGSIHGTLNHLLVGEHLLWWPRIAEGRSPVVALDSEAETDRAALARRLREGAARWPGLIEGWSHDRLHGQLQYARLNGGTVTLPMAETMAHVFNHGTHHRGQISAALTALGQPAPELDLIFMLQQEAKDE